MLAQVETTVEKAVSGIMKTGTDVGNANDSVRLGIFFVLIAVVGGLAFWGAIKVILKQNADIVTGLREQIVKAETRAKDTAEAVEREREGRREDQYARNAVMQYTIDTFNAKFPELKNDLKSIYATATASEDLMRRQLNLGAIPPRYLEESRRVEPQQTREGQREDTASTGRVSFLPTPSRRIPGRPFGGSKEDRKSQGENEDQ